MGFKLCNEFLNCEIMECPSFNDVDQNKCWRTSNTRCKDPVTGDTRPKMVDEKLMQCFGTCKYHQYRKNLGR